VQKVAGLSKRDLSQPDWKFLHLHTVCIFFRNRSNIKKKTKSKRKKTQITKQEGEEPTLPLTHLKKTLLLTQEHSDTMKTRLLLLASKNNGTKMLWRKL
jgi:hypothetical protein